MFSFYSNDALWLIHFSMRWSSSSTRHLHLWRRSGRKTGARLWRWRWYVEEPGRDWSSVLEDHSPMARMRAMCLPEGYVPLVRFRERLPYANSITTLAEDESLYATSLLHPHFKAETVSGRCWSQWTINLWVLRLNGFWSHMDSNTQMFSISLHVSHYFFNVCDK